LTRGRLLKTCNEPAPDAPFALAFGCLAFLSLLGLLYHTKIARPNGFNLERGITLKERRSSFEVQPWCVARLLDAHSKLLEGTEPCGDIRDTQTNESCSGIHNEIADPCIATRNPLLGNFDRPTRYR
jgi:hypothetical protein